MTTKSQEAFEKWWGVSPIEVGPTTYMSMSDEDLISVWAWQSWQAAEAYGRKQVLEDVANGFIKQKSWTQDYAHAIVQHAADEGALK